MKVIGRAGDGYIVQVDKSEMAQLCGFSWDQAAGFEEFLLKNHAHDARVGGLRVGATVPVSVTWKRLEDVRNGKRDLKKVAGTLRGLAELLEGSLPAITIDKDAA